MAVQEGETEADATPPTHNYNLFQCPARNIIQVPINKQKGQEGLIILKNKQQSSWIHTQRSYWQTWIWNKEFINFVKVEVPRFLKNSRNYTTKNTTNMHQKGW